MEKLAKIEPIPLLSLIHRRGLIQAVKRAAELLPNNGCQIKIFKDGQFLIRLEMWHIISELVLEANHNNKAIRLYDICFRCLRSENCEWVIKH